MIEGIIAAIVALLQAIPIFNKWFTKSDIENENQKKEQIEKEHQDNAEKKRPSGEFWKDHGGI